MLLLLLQKAPIVVEVVKQPAPTPSISYGSVLLSAVALVGVILLASVLVGVAVGGIFIYLKIPDTHGCESESCHVLTSVRLWDCLSHDRSD